MREVAIVSAVRTPVGSYGGALKDMSVVELGVVAAKEAISRANISEVEIDEVIIGNILSAGQGQNIARQIAIKAGLPVETPAMTLNILCGSGLRAISLAAQIISSGGADAILCGGAESMSNAPYLAMQNRWGSKMGHVQMLDHMIKDALTDALQLALVLEYLEDQYHAEGLATAGLIPTADRVVFQQIAKHETAHVAFLKAALTSLGATPGTKPLFDFTANGAFTPFTNYQQFLILAQAFEDTGVRAYKGQAGNVMGNKAILQAALQIHSVEARHASQVRRMRMNKGWIELNNGGNMPAATDPVYAGEQVTMQAGFNTATAFGPEAGSAAYDEILTGSQAQAIAALFID